MEKSPFEKPPKLEISPARPEDIKGITDVLYKAWLKAYPNEELGITVEDIEETYKDSFSEESLKKGAEKIANMSDNEHRLVVRNGEQIIGVASVVTFEDINQLKTIYILPERQGQGVGQKLWTEIKKHIDPQKNTFVELADYNVQAISFYEKLGFRDTDRRFSDDRFIMPSGVKLPEMEMVLKAEKN